MSISHRQKLLSSHFLKLALSTALISAIIHNSRSEKNPLEIENNIYKTNPVSHKPTCTVLYKLELKHSFISLQMISTSDMIMDMSYVKANAVNSSNLLKTNGVMIPENTREIGEIMAGL